MKTLTTELLLNLNKKELFHLTGEIAETVATEMNHPEPRPVFSAVKLWNIQRMKKARYQRRRLGTIETGFALL